MNLTYYKQYDHDRELILQNIRSAVYYERLDPKGPLKGKITVENPLVQNYFTRVETKKGPVYLANNGWVWGANARIDFASAACNYYWTRSVIIWGDCVKLRYSIAAVDDCSPYIGMEINLKTILGYGAS